MLLVDIFIFQSSETEDLLPNVIFNSRCNDDRLQSGEATQDNKENEREEMQMK